MRSLPLICLISSAVVSLAITPANAQIVGCKDSNGNIVYREARDCPGLHQPGTGVVRNNTTGTTTGVVATPESRAAQLQVQQLQIQRDANVQRYKALQPSSQSSNVPEWRPTGNPAGDFMGALIGLKQNAGDNAQRVAPPSAQRQTKRPQTGATNSNGCSSDVSCEIGYRCVKPLYEARGTCMQAVNSTGLPTYGTRQSSGFDINTKNQCNFDLDCPMGFACDATYKACVKR